MVFTKILNIAASLFYFTTNNYNGNSFRKNKVPVVIPSYQPPIKFTEYIPLSDDAILFISYPNNIRKDVRRSKYKKVNFATI